MKDVQCRNCKNAYVDWNSNCARCIKVGIQMNGSKGKCIYYIDYRDKTRRGLR